jgi:hypothetical protein
VERQNIDGVWIMRMDRHRKAKIGWDSVGNVLPGIASIVTTVQAPVILQKEPLWSLGVLNDLMHALAKLRIFFGQELGSHPTVLRVPRLTLVVAPVDTSCGNGNDQALGMDRICKNRMKTKSSAPWLPTGSMGMVIETTDQRPRFARVPRLKKCCRLYPTI